MELMEILIGFREITAEAIKVLDTEKYEELPSLLDKREEAIKEIKSFDLNTEQFKAYCDELGLLQLESELDELLKYRRDDVKIKLESISKNMQASTSYNKMVDSPLIFSKKI